MPATLGWARRETGGEEVDVVFIVLSFLCYGVQRALSVAVGVEGGCGV